MRLPVLVHIGERTVDRGFFPHNTEPEKQTVGADRVRVRPVWTWTCGLR
jgi:hypothetical protein